MPRRSAGALLLALALGGCAAEAREPPVAVGSPAPDFAAATLAGDSVSLAGLRGQVVLLNVWATWCPPCRREMPGLDTLHADLRPRGLRVVGVSVDARSAAGEVAAFVAESRIGFTILHDPAARVSDAFRTTGVPETFLIGRDGTLLRRWIGRVEPSSRSVREAVESALAARPAV